METNVNKVLRERGKIYGTYNGGVLCRAGIMSELKRLYKVCNRQDMPEDLSIMFGDVVLKMMRIVSAPEHVDSYVDLAGYTKLIKDRQCKKLEKNS